MAKFRVKELARARAMSSEELARKSGVKISTVRNVWQNRVNDPNYSTLSAIAAALDVAIEELVVASDSDSRIKAGYNQGDTKNTPSRAAA
jgi:transcriptional regulator with XRE-family HTH domain